MDVAAGAGPAPFWIKGNVYMAGPYKGEPLSFVIITPAVAGPFDLGVVVTRVAIHIDPSTAQITATSDPIPDHLTVDGTGFPLDVRSVRVKLDKPELHPERDKLRQDLDQRLAALHAQPDRLALPALPARRVHRALASSRAST